MTPSLLLFIFYVCLILYYYWKGYEIKEKISLKNINENKIRQSLFQSCQSNKECVPDQICFQNKCIPKLRSGDECDPLTGFWSIIQMEKNYFVACTCKYPNIITQNFPGSNCDVDLACGPYGKIVGLPNMMRCLCPHGYKSIETNLNKPACVKMSIAELVEFESGPCNKDEIDTTTSGEMNDIIDSSYLKNKFSPKCIKRPCTFDALTGKPLKKARFEKDWGCVCDPKRGNIGVNIDHPNYLKNISGYNACINIFGVEPLHDIKNVKLYTYFYVFDKRPISFIQYTDLKNPTPLFKSFKNLQIEETWPYNYMQYIFKNFNFKHKPPYCEDGDYPCYTYTNNSQIQLCKNIPSLMKSKYTSYLNNYILFKQFPFCLIDSSSSNSDYYKGWVVSNPFNITLKNKMSKNDIPSNGIVMSPDPNIEDVWCIGSAPSIQDFIDSANEFLVPNFNNEIKDEKIVSKNTEVIEDYGID